MTGSLGRCALVLAVAGQVGLGAGCGDGGLTPVLGCTSTSEIQVDCQFHNPEDLAPSPDGRLIVSQYGGMQGESSGSLALYDPETKLLDVAFPAPGPREASWGDADCAPPDETTFSPHGIDIERRGDGRHQLAVVNHGGRESVELFEVGPSGALTWRGCAIGPDGAHFNDVVLLRDGGFWVTHMFEYGTDAWAPLLAAFGRDTGFVYAWSPQAGFSKLSGSDAPFPNGIEKSADERFVYLNTYSPSGVRKLDVAQGRFVAEHPMAQLDNSTWTSDGRLLVASHTGELRQMIPCLRLEEGACGMPFEIVALDADLGNAEVVLRHEGAPMGGATVALEHRGALYLGSFAGDRIARVSRWER